MKEKIDIDLLPEFGGEAVTIRQFLMEEVRCFAGLQRFNIRPLTFLVGENSSGKTTTLACFQVLANYLNDGEVDFNEHPYSMGIFEDVVRRSRGGGDAFRLGIVQEVGREETEFSFEFNQKEGGFEPVVKSVLIKFGDGQILVDSDGVVDRIMELVSYEEESNKFLVRVDPSYIERVPFRFLVDGLHRVEEPVDREGHLQKYLASKSKALVRRRLARGIINGIDSFSTSPVRSRPKRTYDPTREFEDPEGSDVPMRLMRIESTRKKHWESLRQKLVEFGKSSGLFQSIDVRRLGRSMGAPFQLRVKVRGPKANITDVGYGVSQILPILVQILDNSESRRGILGRSRASYYLLQQPEVHLHPRGQAEFSSLLVQAAKQGRQSFLVETHSDYMIDRARIEIRKGNIKKDDVSLIYLEPKRNIVAVHNITFDETGNMVGVPRHYRDFFLRESSRLLGFEE